MKTNIPTEVRVCHEKSDDLTENGLANLSRYYRSKIYTNKPFAFEKKFVRLLFPFPNSKLFRQNHESFS